MRGLRRGRLRLLAQLQILGGNFAAITKGQGALQDIFEFTYISGEVIARECI